uniref:Uncharacterized protein n=1 Tax=Sparus aurata TaxID=8175 RepID=A0A671W867_SPAAU
MKTCSHWGPLLDQHLTPLNYSNRLAAFKSNKKNISFFAIKKTTVGIYVTRETPGNDFSDVGIIIEGVVVLQDLDDVALATALLSGLFYSLNMRYPSQLRYTFEVIQKCSSKDSSLLLGLRLNFHNIHF